MLKSVLEYFNLHLLPQAEAAAEETQAQLKLAVAVLLVEIAESDFERAPEEKSAILNGIKYQFGLESDEAQTLMDLAEQEHRHSTDYFQFTTLINKNYSYEQKIQVIESLWRVAFADQQLHHYEEHVIRRLADLIHVSHGDFISAKHRVMSD
ncbi:MAG: TerB family tellurite resistance protein [Candidatus Thiodiazotropha sp. (ex. Lucinisca nassula)]|nr:TerB family tellurite resistance protein [Candidatus Thiodiazotropha sp. (ex. Lucinisca nassula)]MBW9261972.1 TerB family tellurite resistance protein [Candidatus Thiodiazotropha sp. (ex. Lucinisca nassula)]MBW9268831.1 TerB family tellurite resistance protein [Candidatus Thiodiazotropha sp. (ex. Lucinisca nassula)]